MTTISRYVLATFLRYYGLLCGMFVFIYLLVDFLDRVDNFIEYRSTVHEVLLYFAYKMPFIILQMSSVSVMLAVVVTFSMMHRHNEIVALKAGGVSVYRLSWPVLLAAGFISLMTFVLAEGVVPQANLRSWQLWEYEMHHEERDQQQYYRHFKGWYRSEHGIYNIRRFLKQDEVLEGVSLYFFDDSFSLVRRVDAYRGRFQGDDWHFTDGVDKTIGQGGVFRMEKFQERTVVLPERPEDFHHVTKSADQMSLKELEAHIVQLAREGYDPTPYVVDRQVKFSLPFVSAVLTLLVIPLTLRHSRDSSLVVGVGTGVAVAFAYLVFFGLSRSFGLSGTLPPALAAWLPNMVFGLVGLYFFATLRQ